MAFTLRILGSVSVLSDGVSKDFTLDFTNLLEAQPELSVSGIDGVVLRLCQYNTYSIDGGGAPVTTVVTPATITPHGNKVKFTLSDAIPASDPNAGQLGVYGNTPLGIQCDLVFDL